MDSDGDNSEYEGDYEDEGDDDVPELKTPEERAMTFKQEGNDLYLAKDFRAAVDCYTKAIELVPEEYTYYGNRAAAQMGRSQFKLALEDCEAAIAMNAGFTKAYLRGARCKMQLGHFEGATAMLETIAARPEGARDPTVAADLKLIRETHQKLNALIQLAQVDKWNEALPNLEYVLTHVGNSEDVQILAAQILCGCGQFGRAGPMCSRLYRSNPSKPAITTLRATTAYYSGQVESALKLLKQVLVTDPDNRRCMRMYKMVKKLELKKSKGNEAFKMGKNQEACDFYTEALAVDPMNKDYNATLYGNRAAANMKLKKYLEAVQDCDRSLALKPEYMKSLLRRANCKLELERYQDAIRDFEKAKEMDPQNRDIRLQLQNAELELKKSKRKNYYKILEITKDADERGIKKAYRKLALRWHPDKNSETPEQQAAAEKKFKDISESYTVLSDATKRRRYDQGADIEEINSGGGGHGHGHGGQDVNDIFRTFFAQGGGGGGGHGGGFNF